MRFSRSGCATRTWSGPRRWPAPKTPAVGWPVSPAPGGPPDERRQLLVIGGAHLPWRALFGLVLASTGLARVMPAGLVTGGAWQIREYRRRGTGAATGAWAVLAGGFTSMVVILALLLAGAAIAGASALFLLGCAAAVPAAGAAVLTMAPRRANALSRRLSHHRRSAAITRLAAAAGLSRQHAGLGWAAGVLACTATGLAAGAGVLSACFGLAGLPVPWRGLLFAYPAGQVAGRLVPLPGGLGGVEGGMLGALTLTGAPPAAAAAAVIVYRVAAHWALGAAGTTPAAALTRRHPRGREPALQQLAGCPGRGAEAAPALGALAMRGHTEGPSRSAGMDVDAAEAANEPLLSPGGTRPPVPFPVGQCTEPPAP